MTYDSSVDSTHFVCIHCNRVVERATYQYHHCHRLDELRESLKKSYPKPPTLREPSP